MSSTPHRTEPVRSAGSGRRSCERGWRFVVCVLTLGTIVGSLAGQAGRREHPSTEASTLLNVTAKRENGSTAPIASKDISLFDNGVEQTIRNLTPDPSPARIV